jgi:hypothetical protein
MLMVQCKLSLKRGEARSPRSHPSEDPRSPGRWLVCDLFEYRDFRAVEVKGLAAPVPAWQVLRPSGVASRFEALRDSALIRLVGRDEETHLVLRRACVGEIPCGAMGFRSRKTWFGRHPSPSNVWPEPSIEERASAPYLQEQLRVSSKVEDLPCFHCALVKRGHLFRDARS